MVDKLTDALDNRSCAMGIFINLVKAFDTVDHNILLQKLSHYGIRALPLDWLNDDMTGRKQYVSYNGVNWATCDVNCDAPQGSILGPFSFSHIC